MNNQDNSVQGLGQLESIPGVTFKPSPLPKNTSAEVVYLGQSEAPDSGVDTDFDIPTPRAVPYDPSQDDVATLIEHETVREPSRWSKLLSGTSKLFSKQKAAPAPVLNLTDDGSILELTEDMRLPDIEPTPSSKAEKIVLPPIMETAASDAFSPQEKQTGESLFELGARKISEKGAGLLNRAEAAGKSLRESAFVREATLNASVAMATASVTANKFGKNLLAGVKNVGKTLIDPNFISRAGVSMLAGGAMRVGAGAVFGASLVPAALAGAVAGVTLGHIQDEYKKSLVTDEPKPEIKGFFNKAAAAGADAWNLVKFGAKKDNWKNFGHHLVHERKVWAGRALLGGAFGALGGLMAGHEGVHNVAEQAVNAKTAAMSAHVPTVDTVDLTSGHGGAVHIAEGPSAPAVAPVAPISVADAQAMKDHAVELYNGIHGVAQDKAQAIDLFKQAAEAGNHQAARDLFNITGEHVGPHITPSHVEAPAAAPASAPAVVADAPVASVSEVAAAANDTTKAVVDAGIATVGTTAAVAGAATVAPAVAATATAGAMALQLNAAQPQTPAQIAERTRIEQVEAVRAQGVSILSKNFIGLDAGTCYLDAAKPGEAYCQPKMDQIQEGDFVRFVNKDTSQEIATILEKPEGGKMSTFEFMRNSISKSFNALAAAVGIPTAQPVANNDNQSPSKAEPMSRAMQVAYGR